MGVSPSIAPFLYSKRTAAARSPGSRYRQSIALSGFRANQPWNNPLVPAARCHLAAAPPSTHQVPHGAPHPRRPARCKEGHAPTHTPCHPPAGRRQAEYGTNMTEPSTSSKASPSPPQGREHGHASTATVDRLRDSDSQPRKRGATPSTCSAPRPTPRPLPQAPPTYASQQPSCPPKQGSRRRPHGPLSSRTSPRTGATRRG